MSITDPVSDLLTRVRNGQSAHKSVVNIPSSKLKIALCKVLEEEGYIEGFSVTGEAAKASIEVRLKYYNGSPVIEQIQRISKPGRRVYKAAANLPTVLGGLGIAIISTSKGLMTDKSARQNGYGGEVLCTVS